MLGVVIHELTHVLGFSSGSYYYYVDEDGNPRSVSNVVGNIRRYDDDST